MELLPARATFTRLTWSKYTALCHRSMTCLSSRDQGNSQKYEGPRQVSLRQAPISATPLRPRLPDPCFSPQNHKLILWLSKSGMTGQDSGTTATATVNDDINHVAKSRLGILFFSNAQDVFGQEIDLSQIAISSSQSLTIAHLQHKTEQSVPPRADKLPATLLPRHGLASTGNQLGHLKASPKP